MVAHGENETLQAVDPVAVVAALFALEDEVVQFVVALSWERVRNVGPENRNKDDDDGEDERDEDLYHVWRFSMTAILRYCLVGVSMTPESHLPRSP